MHRKLWKELCTIESVLVAPGGSWGEIIFSAIPVAQLVTRFWRKWRGQPGAGTATD
jgi:hypothetical protein